MPRRSHKNMQSSPAVKLAATRDDILILADNYNGTSASGPYFQLEDVGVYDLGLSVLCMTDLLNVGDNIYIVAEIEKFNATTGLLKLDPISVHLR